MPYTIHVPQGYSAQLYSKSLARDINALYTDSYSMCNVLVLVGERKVKLLHVDLEMSSGPYVQEEITSMQQQLKQIIMIYREPDGSIVRKSCLDLIPNGLKPKIKEHKIDEDLDGVLVTCSQAEGADITAKIDYLPIFKRPENLIHHPSEQTFLAVQKIRQVIGWHEIHVTKVSIPRITQIFDGFTWEPLSNRELSVRTGHAITDEEMDFFRRKDTFVVIVGKVMAIVKKLQKIGIMCAEDVNHFAFSVAPYLEGYLNNFDLESILRRNLKDTVENKGGGNAVDLAFKLDIIALAARQDDITGEISQAVENYKAKPHTSQLKSDLISEVSALLKHTGDRKQYVNLATQRKEWQRKALGFALSGARSAEGRKQRDASNYYDGAVKLLSLAVDKNNHSLATNYYNLGVSLQKENKHEAALSFLKNSLILKRDYLDASKSDIEKVQLAIAECQANIAPARKSNHTAYAHQ